MSNNSETISEVRIENVTGGISHSFIAERDVSDATITIQVLTQRSLIEAAKQSEWLPSEPYTTVLQVLRGGLSDENSALIVGTNFPFEL